MKLILALMIAIGLTACGKAVDPNDQVKTKITKFSTGGFDTVMIADFTITNNTSTPIKDIEIVCNGYSETGTKIDTNRRTIYKVVAPGQTITVSGNWGISGDNPALATAKGWTVSG